MGSGGPDDGHAGHASCRGEDGREENEGNAGGLLYSADGARYVRGYLERMQRARMIEEQQMNMMRMQMSMMNMQHNMMMESKINEERHRAELERMKVQELEKQNTISNSEEQERIKNATSSMLSVMMEDEDPRFKNS